MRKAIVITLGMIIGVAGVLAICAHLADAAKAWRCMCRRTRMTKISTDLPAFRVRPAQPEEAGVFFAPDTGTVRVDGWHSSRPYGFRRKRKGILARHGIRAEERALTRRSSKRTPAGRGQAAETVLKDLSSMRRFCYENGGKIPGGWSQNYGYVVETEHYEYCLRCNPVPGDYQAYLSCYDLNEQKINHAYQPLVGRVHFINGDAQQFTDAKKYLDCIREELPHEATAGFRFRTITQAPAVRKAVDDIVFDFYGEENPCSEEDYNLAPSEEMEMGGECKRRFIWNSRLSNETEMPLSRMGCSSFAGWRM